MKSFKYQQISDQSNQQPVVEEINTNIDAINNNTNTNKFVLSNKRRRYVLFAWLSLFCSIVILGGILLTNRHPHILTSTLGRNTPFKVVTHPEAPSVLWGVASKPYPTGSFWTNLVVRNGDGAIALHPYGIKTLDTGIHISYGATRRSVSRTAIIDSFASDLQISTTQGYLSRSVESYDNISVTMGYKTVGLGKYRTHLVKGSPFITVVFENTTPIISAYLMKITSIDARVVKDSTGAQYIVTLGNFQKWLVYCSESVALIWKENVLTSPTPIRGFIRIAILPNQNYENAFNTLFTYIQRYPIGGTVSLQYLTGTVSQVTYQYNTVGSGSLLMYALNHHTSIMTLPAVDNEENKRVQAALSPIYDIKGKLKAIVGDTWRLQYNLVQIGWNYILADKLNTAQLDEIARALMSDVKSIIPSAIDVYSFGKEIGRMARIALIADNLGIADVRQQAVSILESSMIPWLQSFNSDPFQYDKTYGGVMTQSSLADPNSNFGAGWYSDHHFHYGYYITAGAVLARFDSGFFDANKAVFDSLVRDICNPDNNDPDYPFARHKDLFDGHSWASGLFQQANGKGQESSSEAVNAYYGVYLYSLATANTDLMRFSHTLLTMEVQSAQIYWHMSSDDIFDSIFSQSRMVGNLGGLDATTSTWFGSELEFVHGINMMPLSPATALLFDQSYVQYQYPVLANRLQPNPSPVQQLCNANNVCRNQQLLGNCCPTNDGTMLGCCDSFANGLARMQDEWKSYIWNDLAVVDRESAWKQILLITGFGSGNSKSNSLYWAASRIAPLSGFNISKKMDPGSNSNAVKASCASNSACDAIGMTGDCCPSSNGVFLGCCPKQ
eukprot:gene3988-5712_t